jgi:hypothetical protein
MRSGERLVQIQVHHVHAEIAGTRDAHQRVHVGAIHVEQRALAMQDFGSLDDARFEDAQRVGVGDHQAGHIFRDGFFERGEIQQAVLVGADVLDHVTGDGRSGGVGAVRGIRNQDFLARIALLFEQGADEQDAGQFALRAGGGLQRDGVHAGDFEQRGFEMRHDLHGALRERFRLIGMRPGEAFGARDQLVDARVVLHGAGAQRIHAVVDGVVPGGEAREVADSFHFADFGEASISARTFWGPSAVRGSTAGTSSAGSW